MKKKLKGIIIRSRGCSHEHVEKSMKYFINLEKRNHVKKLMRQLKISGSITTGPLNTLSKQQRTAHEQNKNVDTISKIESFQRDLKILINFWTSKSSREKEKLLQRNVL